MATFKKCPHCKSTRGFEITVVLGGTHEFKMDFKGNIIDNVRSGSDELENYAACLDCGRLIPSEKLKIIF